MVLVFTQPGVNTRDSLEEFYVNPRLWLVFIYTFGFSQNVSDLVFVSGHVTRALFSIS